ncbi:DUF1648 domain-containing protein [Listeria fleischmannii]|uniref:DUF1648 domain-containing protein n=1 Tax=Listeria fleischmannii TaxID=1069827 RepID=UPI001624C66B|nr:DUF5808 domain-containing protein [Listeria fleischmannii]MBC1419782.1 DUF1648 domain-containing protein [Listeria fleischmannii]
MESIIFTLVSLFIILIEAITPFIVHRTECFGVNVGVRANQEPELKQMKKQYAFKVILYGIFVVVLTFALMMAFSGNDSAQGFLFTTSMFILLIIAFLLYLKYHRRTIHWKARKIKSGEMSESSVVLIDTAFHRNKMIISYTWFLIPFLITLITLAMTVVFYQSAPSVIPSHYDFNGNITNEMPKTVRNVSLLIVMQLFIIGIFMGINYVMSRSKQVLDNDNPSDSVRRNQLARAIFSKAMLVMCILLVLAFFVIQLTFLTGLSPQIATTATLILVLLILVIVLLLAFFVGQGGSRLKMGGSQDTDKTVRDDDRYWKLGIFYFNKSDPSLFVEKRFGIGWTINTARPFAWILLLGVILISILIGVIL